MSNRRIEITRRYEMCIGRYIWLFNSDQYVLQYQPKADFREHALLILDEGRVEVAAKATREVKPEDVAGPRPGGVFMDYPQATKPGGVFMDYPQAAKPGGVFMDYPQAEMIL